MPGFRFDKISDIVRDVKGILKPEDGSPRDAAPGVEQRTDRARSPQKARRRTSEQRETSRRRREFSKAQREKIRSKKWELSQIKRELAAAAKQSEAIEQKRRKKRVQQEIFELERELRAVRERAEYEPVTGALPDFVVIGAAKCGTTFFYDLLTQHPLVEPAASKELHFFDAHFNEGVEWYRQCFPAPRWKDGRRTITGEASPYMSHPLGPERTAQVVPKARLIALLRNPVDRAYSHYQQRASKGKESRTFEEIIEDDHDDSRRELLSKGLYVDHLLRWAEFFDREQLLVLKSEDLFESPKETLKLALDFLGLPDWEPEESEEFGGKRNTGTYEREMDPALRRRLSEYFEPHNKRLYDFLGVDFGW